MNIWIIVYAFAGVIDSVKVFNDEKKAYAYYHKQKKQMNLDEDDIQIFQEVI